MPVPALAGNLGEMDAAATAGIAAHLAAVSPAGAITWKSLSATGEITYPLNPPETDPVTLTILGSDSYRIDISRPAGTESIRIQGSSGVILDPGGNAPRYLPPITAAYGLLDFPLLLTTGFPDNGSALIDRGTATIAGKPLHRVAYERPLLPGSSERAGRILVTDFYFDPTTHLLVKSAEMIDPPSGRGMGARGPFLQVTAYSDYRPVDGLLLPSRFSRTWNGELMWSLQLDQVTLNQPVPASTFSLAGGGE